MAPPNGRPRLPSLVSRPKLEWTGRPRLWEGTLERNILSLKEQGTGDKEDRIEGRRASLFITPPLLDPAAIGCWERKTSTYK